MPPPAQPHLGRFDSLEVPEQPEVSVEDSAPTWEEEPRKGSNLVVE